MVVGNTQVDCAKVRLARNFYRSWNCKDSSKCFHIFNDLVISSKLYPLAAEGPHFSTSTLRWHGRHSVEVNENINLGYSHDQGYS